MLKYRIISLVLGALAFELSSFIIYTTTNRSAGPFLVLVSIIIALAVASKSYSTFQTWDAKKNGHPLDYNDFAHIRKIRFILIVIWAVVAFFITMPEFGHNYFNLSPSFLLSIAIYAVLHFVLTNPKYQKALDEAKSNAKSRKEQNARFEQKELNRKKTEEVWSVLSHKIEERRKDPRVKDMINFFDTLKWLKERTRNEPMTAAQYPYAVEYLPYAYRYQQLLESLKEKCLNSSVESLEAEYDKFLANNLPLSEGYFEKKAAHENSLKSKAKVTGVNDI